MSYLFCTEMSWLIGGRGIVLNFILIIEFIRLPVNSPLHLRAVHLQYFLCY